LTLARSYEFARNTDTFSAIVLGNGAISPGGAVTMGMMPSSGVSVMSSHAI
jgi:hypothetical protein